MANFLRNYRNMMLADGNESTPAEVAWDEKQNSYVMGKGNARVKYDEATNRYYDENDYDQNGVLSQDAIGYSGKLINDKTNKETYVTGSGALNKSDWRFLKSGSGNKYNVGNFTNNGELKVGIHNRHAIAVDSDGNIDVGSVSRKDARKLRRWSNRNAHKLNGISNVGSNGGYNGGSNGDKYNGGLIPSHATGQRSSGTEQVMNPTHTPTTSNLPEFKYNNNLKNIFTQNTDFMKNKYITDNGTAYDLLRQGSGLSEDQFNEVFGPRDKFTISGLQTTLGSGLPTDSKLDTNTIDAFNKYLSDNWSNWKYSSARDASGKLIGGYHWTPSKKIGGRLYLKNKKININV